ncbi:MAG: hypothetical protein D6714_15420, partial [Bacteroidetes bacterium]
MGFCGGLRKEVKNYKKNDMKYLYAASIQGIQSFIFQTNKLREIAGASKLVDDICKELFNESFKVPEENIIMQAAGNV